MQPSNKSIAVLVDTLAQYHLWVLSGIEEALQEAGLPFQVLVGESLQDRINSVVSREIYRLVHPQHHSGVLVLSATVGGALSDGDLQAFLQGFGLPVVGIARAVPGIPTVLTDNRPGMQALMEHLIVQRGFRRFVFMGGREGNSDAIEREQLFLEALHAQGIPMDPQHLLRGHFFAPDAQRAIQPLLQSGHPIDVVVCANDLMAQGVIRAIHEQGLLVPEDIAVTGFDDMMDAAHFFPPITTVRQPFAEQGRMAVQMLLDLLEGKAVPEVVHVGSELVVRESCGAAAQVRPVPAAAPDPARWDTLRSLASCPEHKARFFRLWKRTLWEASKDLSHLMAWRDRLLPLLHEGLDREEAQLWLEAHHLLTHLLYLEHTQYRHSEMVRSYYLSRKELQLVSRPTVQALLNDLPDYFQDRELDRCVLVLQDPAPHWRDRGQVVLTLGVEDVAEPFAVMQLLPEVLQPQLHQGGWLVFPLHLHDLLFGVLFTDVPFSRWIESESLRVFLSQALDHARQREQLLLYTENLEQLVQQRTNALRAANHELQSLASLDELTRIFNRRAFQEKLVQHWQNHLGQQQPLAVLLVDVDHFKAYNDCYGHLEGDRCLQNVAAMLAASLRGPGDLVARYGGEEFIVLLPDTGPQQALALAERIHLNLLQLDVRHQQSRVAPRVTVSVGVCSQVPDPSQQPEDLIRQADGALYRAKQEGRNRTVLHSI